ncbi:zinc metalloprotease [Flammeovirgaceae bacterium SG7u.111]|nr:zinc metalloprotease [Flammeovirgaceae bacterium SG7u.132]WPO37089.1 zinc metalloprotease [Flammeovirgaceae bacterium SG7u.111]
MKLNFLFLYLTLIAILFSCEQNDDIDPKLDVPDAVPENEIIRIPVVVHVVNYAPSPFEISDEKIQSQIDVLNRDYRKKNPDYLKTPDEFMDLVADVGIEFHLATEGPDGKATTGIIRTESTVSGFDGRSLDDSVPIEDLALYFADKGGQDAWPNDKYLNIWIGDMTSRSGKVLLGGYANFPGSDPRIDGVVLEPRVVGTLPPLSETNNLGRTATHEIGHWLHLLHIFAKDSDCASTDSVADTPPQYAQYQGRPTYPKMSCGSSDLFMNYMDYVHDDAMFMFTKGQKKRMRSLFDKGGARRELYLNSRKSKAE